MNAQPVNTQTSEDDDDPQFSMSADGAAVHNADGQAQEAISHTVADEYHKYPQWSQAVQGPRYERESLRLSESPIGDNHWAGAPAGNVEEAKGMLATVVPNEYSMEEWFMGLDWESFGESLQHPSPTFTQWVFNTANEGSWQAQVLWDILRTQHPITVLLVLDEAKQHPLVGSLPPIATVLESLTDHEGSFYIGQSMAIAQEAVKRQTGEYGDGLADLNPNFGDPGSSFMDDVELNSMGDGDEEIDEEPLIHTVRDAPQFADDQ